MLIQDAIEQAKQDGLLIPAKPIASWEGEPRAFLMCRPLHSAIVAGASSPDQKERQRWAQLEAAISLFVEGRLVTSSLLKQLVPAKYEHWELISRRPKPSIRVFGRFALPDVFVGTHHQLRNKLGGMWSPEFEHEKLVCEDYWHAAGLLAPFTDEPKFRYEKYITANARKKLKV